MKQAFPEDEPERSIEEQRRIDALIIRYQRKKIKRRIAADVFLLLIITPIVIYNACVRHPRIDTEYSGRIPALSDETLRFQQTVPRRKIFILLQLLANGWERKHRYNAYRSLFRQYK